MEIKLTGRWARAVVCTVLCVAGSVGLASQRDKTQRDAFRREQACPVTGSHRGACPGYEVDHKKALMNGGPDRPENMQWLSKEQHKQKTKLDVAECRDSYTCKSERLHKKLPWEKAAKGKGR